jgi:8-oxo-dGTP diphosphatase
MVQVVAAILERHRRILIGRRGAGQSHAFKWEFPGGKVEPGESPEQALARELEEELAIRNARGDEVLRYEFQYPGKSAILLIFFRISVFDGEIKNLIYPETYWAAANELTHFDFVEGDRRFLDWWASQPESPQG